MELTDEQIEKALSCCQWALKNCKDCPLDPNTPCFTNLHLATLKYIERLKGSIESAVQSFTRLETLYKICNQKLETAQTQTAISIMQIIMEGCERTKDENGENIVKLDLTVFDRIKKQYNITNEEK